MPDPTDPFDRLERLAPAVDADAATAAFGHRRAVRARRRRAVTGGGLALVVVLVGAAAVLARQGDDGQRVLAGSTTVAPPTTPGGLRPVERRVVTEDRERGLTLAMELPEEATVGERLWVDVTFTNERADAITVEPAAVCREPVSALAGSLEAVSAVKADTGFGAFDADSPGGSGRSGTIWTGDLDALPGVLGSGQDPKVFSGRPEDQLTVNRISCDWVARPPETIEPGASVSRRIAIDLRWATPGSVDGRSLEVLASTGALEAADGTALGKVTVQQPVELHDTVHRQPSYEAAIAADGIAAAPTLDTWVDATLDMGDAPPGFVQQYATGLSWWNGAWEAWILPGRGDGHQTDPLRIRFDPDRMQVVDVRTTFWGHAPSDDPDQPEPTEPIEDVRYHVD